jgi:hypothetical protein
MLYAQNKLDIIMLKGLEAIIAAILLSARASINPEGLQLDGPLKILDEVRELVFPKLGESRKKKIQEAEEFFKDEEAMAPMKLTLPEIPSKGLVKKTKE